MEAIIRANEIVIVPINKLIPHPENPNKHSSNQIDRLVKIIKYQGFRRPVTVSNQTGFITVGHCRVEAAKKIGMKSLPVIYQDYEDSTQEYADLVADNAIDEWSELDFSIINSKVPDLGPELDIELLGINDFEIDFADKLSMVNKGDENSEWVGMPEFEQGETEIRLSICFKTENEREKFVKKHELEITSKRQNQWLIRY
jgi:hypothetical protein